MALTSRSETSGTGNEPLPSEKKNKEMSFSVSVREAAEMKPTDDDSIKAIVLMATSWSNLW